MQKRRRSQGNKMDSRVQGENWRAVTGMPRWDAVTDSTAATRRVQCASQLEPLLHLKIGTLIPSNVHGGQMVTMLRSP